jgi:hypothetical protein
VASIETPGQLKIALQRAAGLRTGRMLRWLLSPFILTVRLLAFLWFRLTLLFLRGNAMYHRLPEKFTSSVHAGLLYRVLNRQETLWFHYLGFLSRLAQDKQVHWLILSFPDLESLDWSQVEELRKRLNEVRDSGKELIGHSEKGA